MNKIDFILLFDAADANPNGDPDAGNLPRIDGETGHGLVTDVCLKRKIRNFVQITRENSPGCRIYVMVKTILNNTNKQAYDALKSDWKEFASKDSGGKGKKKGKQGIEADGVRKWMCANFYDIRTFGAVMTNGVNCGQVRGPVQLSFARSIDPVTVSEFSLTRCAVTTEAESEEQEGDNRTMGRKFTVPYGLYMAKGTVNPFFAEKTGFSEDDLALLIDALKHMFDFDASAARPAGSMAMRKIILFRHSSRLGNAPAHKLYDAIHVSRKDGVDTPRSFADYDVSIDEVPEGVTVELVDC